MIFPQLAKVLFVVYLIVATLFTIVVLLYDDFASEGKVLDILGIWVAVVVIRITSEWVILFFRINETLTDIRQHLKDNKPKAK